MVSHKNVRSCDTAEHAPNNHVQTFHDHRQQLRNHFRIAETYGLMFAAYRSSSSGLPAEATDTSQS